MWGSPLQKGEVPAPFPGTCSEQLFPPFPPLWILVRPLFTTQRKVSKQEGGHTDMWGQGFPAKGKTALRRIAVKWPLKENGDVYLYNWITLLNSKNYYNLVNQLQFNTTSKKWKKKKKRLLKLRHRTFQKTASWEWTTPSPWEREARKAPVKPREACSTLKLIQDTCGCCQD